MNKVVIGVLSFLGGLVTADYLTKGGVRKAASDKFNKKDDCACRIPESVTVRAED